MEFQIQDCSNNLSRRNYAKTVSIALGWHRQSEAREARGGEGSLGISCPAGLPTCVLPSESIPGKYHCVSEDKVPLSETSANRQQPCAWKRQPIPGQASQASKPHSLTGWPGRQGALVGLPPPSPTWTRSEGLPLPEGSSIAQAPLVQSSGRSPLRPSIRGT